MTKDDIISLPRPELRQRSKKVGLVDEQVLEIIAGMRAATLDWEASRDHEVGVALAAVQINQMLRIIVIRENTDDRNNHDFHTFINPEITKYEGTLLDDYEGCLSVPYIYGKVPRHEKIRVKALNENGQEFRLKAEGFLARVLQHEIDHTNGVVFVDHIKGKSAAFYHLNEEGVLEPIDYQNEIVGNAALWSK